MEEVLRLEAPNGRLIAQDDLGFGGGWQLMRFEANHNPSSGNKRHPERAASQRRRRTEGPLPQLETRPIKALALILFTLAVRT